MWFTVGAGRCVILPEQLIAQQGMNCNQYTAISSNLIQLLNDHKSSYQRDYVSHIVGGQDKLVPVHSHMQLQVNALPTRGRIIYSWFQYPGIFPPLVFV